MAEKYKITGICKKKTDVRNAKRTINDLCKKNKEKSVYISKYRINLKIDKYANIITRVLNETKASLRSQGKSMMTPKGREDGHITTRAKHQQQVADIAVQIAEVLGLNTFLAREQAEHHDDGHTFNGHYGERTMNIIGQLYNCGYSVHNALSIDMLNSENIIEKIKDAIKIEYPDITKEELDEVENEINIYFFDGILAHNGEGIDREIWPQFNKSKKDVIEEKNNCYRIKAYDKNIKPTTMEGAILRFADIIAYTRTDILDGFRLNLIGGFDENGVKNGKPMIQDESEEYYQGYLKVIGTVISYKEKLEGKKSVLDIDEENRLEAERKNINRRLNQIENSINKELDKIKLVEDNKTEKLKIIKTIEYLKIMTYEEKEKLKNIQNEKKIYETKKIEVARKYLSEIPKEYQKEEIVDLMKNVFIKDLEEYSKDKDYIGFSPAIGEALFKLRDYNLNYIVKYTRREFETKILPNATLQLVDRLASCLIDTGIIYEKVLPESIKKQVKPLGDVTKFEERINSLEMSKIMPIDKEKYERKVFHRCGNLCKNNPKRLEEICENAMESIPNIAEHDLNIVEGNEQIDMKISEEDKETSLIYNRYLEKIDKIKILIEQNSKDGVFLSDEEKKNIIVKDSIKNIEQIYAYAFAKEYVEGMSDDTIIDALENTGLITNKQAIDSRTRSNIADVKIDPATQALGKIWSEANNIR